MFSDQNGMESSITIKTLILFKLLIRKRPWPRSCPWASRTRAGGVCVPSLMAKTRTQSVHLCNWSNSTVVSSLRVSYEIRSKMWFSETTWGAAHPGRKTSQHSNWLSMMHVWGKAISHENLVPVVRPSKSICHKMCPRKANSQNNFFTPALDKIHEVAETSLLSFAMVQDSLEFSTTRSKHRDKGDGHFWNSIYSVA